MIVFAYWGFAYSTKCKMPDPTVLVVVLGRHGSASLCRVEREKKMAATYNVLAFKR